VGSARVGQELRDRAAAQASRDDLKHKEELLARKRAALKARIAELENDFVVEAHDIEQSIDRERSQQATLRSNWTALVAQREQVKGQRGKGRRAAK
jgi:hypothetical protein